MLDGHDMAGLMRMRGLYGSKHCCQECCAANDGDGGEVEEGEGWKVVVVDAESGINDMFEVENHLTWWWYLNFNRCTVR